jgi:amino acid permease
MLSRYLKVFWRKIVLLVVIIALIIISSKTKGRVATLTSVATGILLIIVGIYYTYWILKTPTRKEKDEPV